MRPFPVLAKISLAEDPWRVKRIANYLKAMSRKRKVICEKSKPPGLSHNKKFRIYT